MKIKINKEELIDLIINNFTDGFGDINISDLDFGDFDCDIILDGIKSKGNISQGYHKNKGVIQQGHHKNTGDIWQAEHTNNADIHQAEHENNGEIHQDSHNNTNKIWQSNHKNNGDIHQEQHKNNGEIHQDSHNNTNKIWQFNHKNTGSIWQSRHENEGVIFQEAHKNNSKIFQASHNACRVYEGGHKLSTGEFSKKNVVKSIPDKTLYHIMCVEPKCIMMLEDKVSKSFPTTRKNKLGENLYSSEQHEKIKEFVNKILTEVNKLEV